MKTNIKRFNIAIFLFTLIMVTGQVFGQEATPKNNKANRTSKMVQEKVGRPDIPGDLMIEFGFNWMREHVTGYGFNTMGSRTFNAYYLYEMNLGESAFSFHPGIGLGNEKYKFEENITLGYGDDGLGNTVVQFVQLDSIYGVGTNYKKSQINANYLDIPIELRWRSRKYDPKSSFKVTVGGKVGVLIDSKTKIKYSESGDNKITKQKERYELNGIRYGVYGKLGFGGFSAYFYYSLSDVFQKDKGPMGTTMYPVTFGLSLALF